MRLAPDSLHFQTVMKLDVAQMIDWVIFLLRQWIYRRSLDSGKGIDQDWQRHLWLPLYGWTMCNAQAWILYPSNPNIESNPPPCHA